MMISGFLSTDSSNCFNTYFGISVLTTFLYLSFKVGYISFLYFSDVVNSSNTSTTKPFFLKKSFKLLIKLVLPVLGVPVNSITYGELSDKTFFSLYTYSFL